MSRNEPAFEKLLELLAPEREQAGQRYEELRRGLVRFFEWRGCTDPHTLTDEVMDRVARRVTEGESIHASDPRGYFYGVARNVWRESVKKARREQAVTSSVARAARNPTDDLDRETEASLACLDRCLTGLPPETRALVLRYYQDHGIARIENRRRLAQTLTIEPGTLRIRMLRLRDRLEACVTRCLDQQGVTDSVQGSLMSEESDS
ncbi:MAG: hypothetical protein AB1714_31505 [Acidobacteriota bacterium]